MDTFRTEPNGVRESSEILPPEGSISAHRETWGNVRFDQVDQVGDLVELMDCGEMEVDQVGQVGWI